MVRKKIDNRIRVMIENGVILNHRTLFVVVGNKGRDQVVILHHMLSKSSVKARPDVLWCYKDDLGFTSHRKARMNALKHKIKAGKININDDDPFELFISSTKISYRKYKDTQKVLGNTYGMLVLQDFEALTPNLLARTIETVEGGGIVTILVKSVDSLKQLYTMSMDVHKRYRTESHHDVVGRFNERFLLSLSQNERCLVIDDQLTVLPITSRIDIVPLEKKPPLGKNHERLLALKDSLKATKHVFNLISECRTLDQATAVLKFIEAIAEKTLRSTVSLTASRGRGKSAALGLAVAGAISHGYANIFVSSPSPENLKTFFEFVIIGLKALAYDEHLDFSIVKSTNPDDNHATVRVNVFKERRQMIQYIHPTEGKRLMRAELVVIDEAAAIPLPFVKNMLGPYLVFLSSTINGYEGTGRSLSLKLLQQLRQQAQTTGSTADKNTVVSTGRTLQEITLDESIRYGVGDPVEKWLSDLLCLDATSVKPISTGYPSPEDCSLYYVNRDTLFCYHKASESFLHRIVSLFVSSHYKNSPNDLQMMSDAPAHHIFCLLGPVDPNTKTLPDVFCVVQAGFINLFKNMGSEIKNKHKSRKRKHYRSSESSEKEYERSKHKHHKKPHEEKRERISTTILIGDDSTSDSDVMIVTPSPVREISHRHRNESKRRSQSPRKKIHVSPPPAPKIHHRKSPKRLSSSNRRISPSPGIPINQSSDESLSIEDTNRLRIKLGLKPLDVGGTGEIRKNEKRESKDVLGGVDMGDFVHRRPENLGEKSKNEKLKEKIENSRKKRELDKKLEKIRTLGDDSSDDDATAWVNKTRLNDKKKEISEKNAKELDEHDKVFGISDVIKQDIRKSKQKAYTSKDITGLRVEHDVDNFKEGHDVILTLKDKDVLDEDDDTLINVNILDEERYKKNTAIQRKKPGYHPSYEDEFENLESELDDKNVLSKYDEEIDGVKKSSFIIGTTAKEREERKQDNFENKLLNHLSAIGKKLESLVFSLQPATEYMTEQEVNVKFKKVKKKVRKVRKVRPLTADDLLRDAPLSSLNNSVGNAEFKASNRATKSKLDIKVEPSYNDDYIDTDDLPMVHVDNKVKIDINDEDDVELQIALQRTRRLQQLKNAPPVNETIIKNEFMEIDNSDQLNENVAGAIIMNDTAEFYRTLGDIPTYGQAGNREDKEEIMDLEMDFEPEKLSNENYEELLNSWNEVDIDSKSTDATNNEAPILEAEPDICTGVAGALKMAISKGYIQKETDKRPSASRFSHLQAQNYSIEDKAHSYEDDKHSRQERYAGPTSDFKEKEGYKPNVKLEYPDDSV